MISGMMGKPSGRTLGWGYAAGVCVALLLLVAFPGRLPAQGPGEDAAEDQLRVRVRVKVLEWYLRNQLDTGFAVQYLRDVSRASNNIARGDATFPSAGGPNEGIAGFFDRIKAGPGNLDVAIQALERSDQVRILSEPVLTVNANTASEAKFFSGLDVPYEALRSTQSVLVSVTQFRSMGVTLKISDPKVFALEEDPTQRFVNMKFQVEVSRPGQEIPVAVNNNRAILAPQVLSRSLNTTLFLPEDSPFIAGIIKSRIKVDSHNGIPLLSEIPVVGALFRSNSRTDMDTELIFLVTTQILWPGTPQSQTVAVLPAASAVPASGD